MNGEQGLFRGRCPGFVLLCDEKLRPEFDI